MFKIIQLVLWGVYLCVPSSTSAHVKWFSGNEQPAGSSMLSLLDPTLQVWLVLSVIGLVLALIVDKLLPPFPTKIDDFINKNQKYILAFFQMMVGLSLLGFTIIGSLMSPQFVAGQYAFDTLLKLAQACIGVMLLTTRFPKVAGLSLIGLFILTGLRFNIVDAMDNLYMVGIGLFLVLYAKEKDLRTHALPAVRLLTGLALVIAAFSEKLFQPGVATAVIAEYNLNFMPLLGFSWFSDYQFAISAGVMEVLFGVIMCLGIVTRLNVFFLVGFLVTSNLYFFATGYFQEGMIEIIGHLPILAVGLMLICYGSGRRSIPEELI